MTGSLRAQDEGHVERVVVRVMGELGQQRQGVAAQLGEQGRGDIALERGEGVPVDAHGAPLHRADELAERQRPGDRRARQQGQQHVVHVGALSHRAKPGHLCDEGLGQSAHGIGDPVDVCLGPRPGRRPVPAPVGDRKDAVGLGADPQGGHGT